MNRTDTPTRNTRIGSLGAFTLLFAATFTVMVGSLITPALPSIAQHLGFRNAAGWLVTLPSLGVVLFGPFAGRLIDSLGARRAMIGGLLCYGFFGELVVVLGFSATAVLADRLLLGAATAVVMASGTTLIADFFKGAERLKMIARQGMAIELGGVLFLALGGVLGQLGWRMPFLLYLLSWVCLALVLCALPTPKQEVHRSTGSTNVSSNILLTYLCAFAAMTIFFVAYITLPTTLATRFSFSEAATGYFMALISLVAVIVAGALPPITTHIPARHLLTSSFLFFGAGHLLFAIASARATALFGAVFMGIGFGFSIPIVNHIVVDESPAHSRGRNLSYLSVAIFLGQFASSFVTLALPSPLRAMAITGACSVLCAAALCLYRVRNKHA